MHNILTRVYIVYLHSFLNYKPDDINILEISSTISLTVKQEEVAIYKKINI